MRICHVSNLYPPDVLGGAETAVREIVHGLRAAGHAVTVIATAPRARAGRENVEGISVHRVATANLYWAGAAPHRAPALKPLWHLIDLWNPIMYRRVRDLLRAEKFDVVHTHNLTGFSPAAWAAAARIPIVHTTHDHSLTCVRAMRMTRRGRVCDRQCAGCALRGRWFRRLSRVVSAVVAPSRFVLDRHLELGFFPRARSAVVPWAAPPVGASLPERRGAAGAPVRFLFVGALRPHKGIGVLLDAFGQIPDARASLDIAGAGELAAACADAAARDPRIRFHGFVTGREKAGLFGSSDVLLLPTLCWEVVGLVALEALSYGLPVLASRTGGIPEFVDEGSTGFFVAPGDAAALARSMARLAHEPATIQAMRTACRTRAGQLTLERTVDGIVEMYEAARAARP